ncbi:MAG TPA: tyrosinase family protein [Thermoanaerobaculia bacterium]|nr:tyrosinase family protein [Thermoanaerobaculia bacterium]
MKRLVCLLVLSLLAVPMVAQKKATRLPWQDFAKDPKRVQAFRNAVATMKARSSADPKSLDYRGSWIYWGSMHGYFGPNAKAGTVAAYRTRRGITDPSLDQYFVNVNNMTPPDAVAQKVWDQCQHNTPYFFAWHRFYLYYFERVLQAAAKDPTLRLPYWDYTDTANLALPAEFRSPTYVNAAGQTVDNPLFEPRRAAMWIPPQMGALPADDTDIDMALDLTNFFNTTNSNGEQELGYQSTIERGVHGNVHCDMIDCPVTVMGAVAYSSNDPIFWLHHANIDRMWDCWASIPGHKNPMSPDYTKQQFSYVNEKGQLVTKRVRNLYDGSTIDVVYAQAKNCQRPAPPKAPQPANAAEVTPPMSQKAVAAARAALAEPMMIGESGRTLINAAVTRAQVMLPATASTTHPRQFALRAQTQLPVRTELVLRNIHFAMHPRARFNVFLERADNPERRALVGTISFFEDLSGEGEHAGHGGGGNDTRVLDATRALRALGLEGTGTQNVNVVFEANEQLATDFDPAQSQLTVDQIELRVRRDL